MSRHSLIPKDAEDLMRKQDARRERDRREIGTEADWRNRFARNLEAELQLALEGKSADVVETAEGPIVVKPIREKYRSRHTWLRVCQWQRKTFRNSCRPLFHINRKPFIFRFNAGGRLLTISIGSSTRELSGKRLSFFRLYLLGWSLMQLDGKWSFQNTFKGQPWRP